MLIFNNDYIKMIIIYSIAFVLAIISIKISKVEINQKEFETLKEKHLITNKKYGTFHIWFILFFIFVYTIIELINY